MFLFQLTGGLVAAGLVLADRLRQPSSTWNRPGAPRDKVTE
jgi:hypothetical protein